MVNKDQEILCVLFVISIIMLIFGGYASLYLNTLECDIKEVPCYDEENNVIKDHVCEQKNCINNLTNMQKILVGIGMMCLPLSIPLFLVSTMGIIFFGGKDG